jgi:phosphohistidine swiveling domain-containing protein
MPGLLETKLNVKWEDIPAAVTHVWDSWDTEHAKAYREAKGISHELGTGVLIQRMVPAKYAGVAFTADPADPDNSFEFNPLIEYVKGLGEKLVSGEVTPTRAELGSDIYSRLYNELERIHKAYGPSDVEWCITHESWGGTTVWFVQQRAIKFTAAAKSVAEDIPVEDRLVRGKSIGGQVRLHLEITTDAKKAAGKALYLTTFDPKFYQGMLKAAAILTLEGGATCHASIIAREMGKPAISLIQRDFVKAHHGKVLLIDGATGIIAKSNESPVKQKKAKAIKAVLDHNRIPNMRLLEGQEDDDGETHRFDLHKLLTRFYVTVDKKLKGTMDAAEADRRIDEVAQIVCTYLYTATACEARYIDKHASGVKEQELRLKALALGLPVNKGHDRSDFADALTEPKTIQDAIEVSTTVKAIFRLKWTKGYGGRKWAAITYLVLRYLTGKLSPTMFVDAAFNLEHNNGCCFTKFNWMKCNSYGLKEQLNTKQKKTIEALINITDSFVGSEYDTQDCIIPPHMRRAKCANFPQLEIKFPKKAIKKNNAQDKETQALIASNTATVSRRAVQYSSAAY